MELSDDGLKALTATWRDRWGDRMPLLEEVGDPSRWVRFHSLPESKRYAESEAEYETILHRHRTVIGELGPAEWLYVIAAYYDEPTWRRRPDPAVHRGAVHWLTIEDGESDYFVGELRFFAARAATGDPSLDLLLRRIADDELHYVIIAPPDLRWLYHPYDGGADVIAETMQERDALKARHPDWLSTHPSGR